MKRVRIFTEDVPIIEEGVGYLGIVRFTYLFFAVTQILLASMRSVESVKIAFRLSVMTLLVNCGINYGLIFGHFGAPCMGAKGAAVGTLAARVLECVVLIWYVIKKDEKLRLRLKDYLSTDKVLVWDYIKIVVPILIVQGLWGVNTALQTVILGHMTAGRHCGKQCCGHLVSGSEICGSRGVFDGVSADWQNDWNWRYGAGETICEKIAMLVCTDWRGVGDLFCFLFEFQY